MWRKSDPHLSTQTGGTCISATAVIPPTTTIRYVLKESHLAHLVVYNSLGQKIRTLVHEPQTAGIHTIQWNGKNENGEKVASGIYFYQLKAGSFVKTRRMMLIE